MTTDERRRLMEGARMPTTTPPSTLEAASPIAALLQLIATERQALGLTDTAFWALAKEHCGTSLLDGPTVEPAALAALYRALRALQALREG